jgi:hypothetical protein
VQACNGPFSIIEARKEKKKKNLISKSASSLNTDATLVSLSGVELWTTASGLDAGTVAGTRSHDGAAVNAG